MKQFNEGESRAARMMEKLGVAVRLKELRGGRISQMMSPSHRANVHTELMKKVSISVAPRVKKGKVEFDEK